MDEPTVIHPGSRNYPKRLESVIDGKLWAIGNTALMGKPAIGICGSRDASERALEWAYKFGHEAVRQGMVVVSGYARGIDRQAHLGALDAGGSTIAVLPAGIRHFSLVRELRDKVDYSSNFLALSMFDPDASWQVWRAMERNRLIVGLSVGLFVIEAKEQGGTINAAHECVRQGKYLWAVAYKNDPPEGNKKLISTAAVPLSKMSELRQALQMAMSTPPPEVKQLLMELVGDWANGSQGNV